MTDAPGRGRVRDLALRLLGLVYLAAFLSLLVQVRVLFGHEGLLPAADYLEAIRPGASLLDVPTLFWLDASDRALVVVAAAGLVPSLGLVLGIAPRWCLVAVWALYLSFVAVGQDFLAFQWDNLLLESAFFALFVAPGGLRPRRAPAPHPLGVFLVLWLVLRLHVESGAAKLLGGDPSWWDLTAMVSYYETAPLPTWVAWWAHQLPETAHRATSLATLVVELAVAPLLFGPRRFRAPAFVVMAAVQVGILLTVNYGVFNYLTLVLLLFVLDDGHLGWVARAFGRPLAPSPPRAAHRGRTLALAAAVMILVPVSVVPFLPFLRPPPALERAVLPVRRVLQGFRSVNAYHLFARMTLVRREVVIEGSADGVTWWPYEFHWKPGPPDRAPSFVAPHQPRVDFRLWFLLLGPVRARYFDTLLHRLLSAPETVASLFALDPFPETPPRRVRALAYLYRFTDPAERRATGAWWSRQLLGVVRTVERRAGGGEPR